MAHDVHAAAHTLVESIAAIVLLVSGAAVLGLMARRRRFGLTTSVVRSNASAGRTAASIAMVPFVGLAFLVVLVALLGSGQPGVPMAGS